MRFTPSGIEEKMCEKRAFRSLLQVHTMVGEGEFKAFARVTTEAIERILFANPPEATKRISVIYT